MYLEDSYLNILKECSIWLEKQNYPCSLVLCCKYNITTRIERFQTMLNYFSDVSFKST